MVADMTIARNEIHDRFQTVWDADAGAVVGGSPPPVAYDAKPFKPPAGPWARIEVRHATGGNSALSGGLGAPSRVRTTKNGLVTVAVFVPSALSLDTKVAEGLALVAKSAFEGKQTPSAVWFRDVVAVEVGVSDAWVQFNVLAAFEYVEFAASS